MAGVCRILDEGGLAPNSIYFSLPHSTLIDRLFFSPSWSLGLTARQTDHGERKTPKKHTRQVSRSNTKHVQLLGMYIHLYITGNHTTTPKPARKPPSFHLIVLSESPTCSPARAGLLQHRSPSHISFNRVLDFPDSPCSPPARKRPNLEQATSSHCCPTVWSVWPCLRPVWLEPRC